MYGNRGRASVIPDAWVAVGRMTLMSASQRAVTVVAHGCHLGVSDCRKTKESRHFLTSPGSFFTSQGGKSTWFALQTMEAGPGARWQGNC